MIRSDLGALKRLLSSIESDPYLEIYPYFQRDSLRYRRSLHRLLSRALNPTVGDLVYRKGTVNMVVPLQRRKIRVPKFVKLVKLRQKIVFHYER
jgi:hypothetical protein